MLDVASGAFKEVFRRQTSFNAFLLSRMGFPTGSRDELRKSVPLHAVFIKRLHNRRILNAGDVVAASDAVIRAAMCREENSEERRPTSSCHDRSYSSTVVLDDMPVVKQATVMQSATVVVASHGQVTLHLLSYLSRTLVMSYIFFQGAANLIFMRPGTSLILLMPPGWYGWKWLYGNLALASGINVFVSLCNL